MYRSIACVTEIQCHSIAIESITAVTMRGSREEFVGPSVLVFLSDFWGCLVTRLEPETLPNPNAANADHDEPIILPTPA